MRIVQYVRLSGIAGMTILLGSTFGVVLLAKEMLTWPHWVAIGVLMLVAFVAPYRAFCKLAEGHDRTVADLRLDLDSAHRSQAATLDVMEYERKLQGQVQEGLLREIAELKAKLAEKEAG